MLYIVLKLTLKHKISKLDDKQDGSQFVLKLVLGH